MKSIFAVPGAGAAMAVEIKAARPKNLVYCILNIIKRIGEWCSKQVSIRDEGVLKLRRRNLKEVSQNFYTLEYPDEASQ